MSECMQEEAIYANEPGRRKRRVSASKEEEDRAMLSKPPRRTYHRNSNGSREVLRGERPATVADHSQARLHLANTLESSSVFTSTCNPFASSCSWIQTVIMADTPTSTPLRIGTRTSSLAAVQAMGIRDSLQKIAPGHSFKIEALRTLEIKTKRRLSMTLERRVCGQPS